MDTQALATELAAIDRECPRCEGKGDTSNNPVTDPQPCYACHGTGRVPLFEGVRDECPCLHDKILNHTENCLACAGCGWTATLSLERWLVAAKGRYKAGSVVWHEKGYLGYVRGELLRRVTDGYSSADTPLLALLRALKQATEAPHA